MNIVFLSNQAIQKSQILNLLQQELNDELYGTSATDRVMTGLSLFTEGLWGASMGIAHPAMSLATGVSASGLSLGSEMVSEIRNRRNNKCIQRLLKEIKQQTNLLQREVRLLYYGFKEGADTATMRLVQLVGESSVNEVRENIEMENYFRAKWAEEKLVKPVARNSPDH